MSEKVFKAAVVAVVVAGHYLRVSILAAVGSVIAIGVVAGFIARAHERRGES